MEVAVPLSITELLNVLFVAISDKGKVQALSGGSYSNVEKLLEFIQFCENHTECRRTMFLRVRQIILPFFLVTNI